MKKTYMIPATEVVKMELQQFLAASSLTDLTETGGTITLTDDEAEGGAAGW